MLSETFMLGMCVGVTVGAVVIMLIDYHATKDNHPYIIERREYEDGKLISLDYTDKVVYRRLRNATKRIMEMKETFMVHSNISLSNIEGGLNDGFVVSYEGRSKRTTKYHIVKLYKEN